MSAYTAAEARRLVEEFFKGDTAKADAWFDTPNPLLGGVRPSYMIEIGRAHHLLRVIQEQLADNRPSEPIVTATEPHGKGAK